MVIYCCEEHVDLAVDMVVDEFETFPVLSKFTGDNLSTAVNIVKIQLYILWRTNDSIQDVDKNCGHVDNFCGYHVCKLFVI